MEIDFRGAECLRLTVLDLVYSLYVEYELVGRNPTSRRPASRAQGSSTAGLLHAEAQPAAPRPPRPTPHAG